MPRSITAGLGKRLIHELTATVRHLATPPVVGVRRSAAVRLPGSRAAGWSLLPCASDARISLRQTSRISSASGEPSGHARDNMIAPTEWASMSISSGAGRALVRIPRRIALGLKGRQQVLDPGCELCLMSAG